MFFLWSKIESFDIAVRDLPSNLGYSATTGLSQLECATYNAKPYQYFYIINNINNFSIKLK